MFTFSACPYTALSRREKISEREQVSDYGPCYGPSTDLRISVAQMQGNSSFCRLADRSFSGNAVTAERGLRGIVLRHSRCVEMAAL